MLSASAASHLAFADQRGPAVGPLSTPAPTAAEASDPRTSSGRPVRGHAASRRAYLQRAADLKQHTRVARAAYLVCPVLGVTIRAVLLTRVDFSSSVVLLGYDGSAGANWFVLRQVSSRQPVYWRQTNATDQVAKTG
jgi:hypothetical protein